MIWTEAFADTAYFLDTSNWENGALYIGKHLIKAMASGEFVVKEGTVSIGGGAFEDCGDLTGVLLPSTVTAVGHFAFQSCTGLKSITLPAGMTRIYGTAFHQSGITDAFFENPNGWYLQNTLTDVSDPSVAATYLKLPVYTPWERREVAPPHGQS